MKELYLLRNPYVFNGVECRREDSIFSLIGVPFDSTSSYRPGSRFAPQRVREASQNIELYSLRSGLDMERVPIYDEGDLAVVHGDVYEVMKRLEYVVEDIVNEGKVLIALGGEHIITYGILRGFKKPTCVLYFDAHADLRDEYLGYKLSHACTLRRLVEIVGPDKVFIIGLRALCSEEVDYIRKSGIKYLTSLMCQGLSFMDVVNNVRKFLRGCENVYVSIDIDVIDPAYAPGVANPEPEGLSPTYLLNLLSEVINESVWGFDIVEVVPPIDPSGITSVLAAKIINELASYIYIAKGKGGELVKRL